MKHPNPFVRVVLVTSGEVLAHSTLMRSDQECARYDVTEDDAAVFNGERQTIPQFNTENKHEINLPPDQ